MFQKAYLSVDITFYDIYFSLMIRFDIITVCPVVLFFCLMFLTSYNIMISFSQTVKKNFFFCLYLRSPSCLSIQQCFCMWLKSSSCLSIQQCFCMWLKSSGCLSDPTVFLYVAQVIQLSFYPTVFLYVAQIIRLSF